MDLPNRAETDRDGDQLAVVLPTGEQAETMCGIVRSMAQWLELMTECVASGDLLRLLHLSATLGEHNSWLAGFIDKVMDRDCRS